MYYFSTLVTYNGIISYFLSEKSYN